MQVQLEHATAAVVISLSIALPNASCVQSRMPTLEAEGAGGAPLIETTDDDSFGSDPDVGAGIGSEPPASNTDTALSSERNPYYPAPSEEPRVDDPLMLKRCLDLIPASVPRKDEFCRSLADNGARGRCWKNRWSRLAWTGWCYAEFTD